jgi:hypothetical protein
MAMYGTSDSETPTPQDRPPDRLYPDTTTIRTGELDADHVPRTLREFTVRVRKLAFELL